MYGISERQSSSFATIKSQKNTIRRPRKGRIFFIASEKCSGTGLNFANFIVFGIACVDVSSRFSGTLRKYLFSF